MDTERLDLEIDGLVRPGRRSVDLAAAFVRPLQVADLALLAVPGHTEAMTVTKVSERHHALARLLASGVAPGEAAVVIGYTLSRVSLLQGDPAFAELVAFYRDRVDTEFMDTMGQLAGMSKDLIQELRTRLEDNPEKFDVKELKDLLVTTLDRSGFGPTHKQETNVNINLSARLDEARRRALEARMEYIKDVTPRIEAAE